jgi:glycosyltransferase involved in cell wall biosynthesis
VSALVTVVVPTYNGARHLEPTLDSLGAQDHADLQVLVVDDGSTDGSAEIAEAHPAVTRVVRQANQGVAVARNRGLAEATGRWVGFVDQDDLWHRTRVSTLLALADDTGASAVATTERAFSLSDDREALRGLADGREDWAADWIAEGGERTLWDAPATAGTGAVESIDFDRVRRGPATLTTSVLYDRTLAISAGGCAPHARALDDYLLLHTVARLVGTIPRVDTEDLYYRVHPASTTTVSPLAGPYLSTLAALRLGRANPGDLVESEYVDHLLFELPRSSLRTADQLGLLLLSVPARRRARWLMRWAARRAHLR